MKDISTLFKPRSVAVIGASSKEGKVGNIVVKNLLKSGYQGTIYPINPKEEFIEGLKNYHSVLEVPGEIDLVVVSIPAVAVCDAARECVQKGVKNMIVLTAGFKEVGKEGAELEKELVQIANEGGMNILGPNVIGSIDTKSPINASFGQMMPHQGDIAFISQSGAMLVAILDWSVSVGIGFSKTISIGNKADISEIDLIEYLGDDPDTNVILCYLESISNGDDFLKVVSEVSKKKPIVILKSGSSSAGAKAASSHTGALAGSDMAYDLAFLQTGAIRAHSMTELFDLGLAFSKLPLPKGDRVAVVTNAGGGGVVTADAVEKSGLKMATLSEKTIAELKEALPHEANVQNPIDVLGDAPPERYQAALEKVAHDEGVDAIIVMTCPTASAQPVPITAAIIETVKANTHIPIFPVNMGGVTFEESKKMLMDADLPVYTFPETPVSILKRMSEYTAYLENAKSQEVINITDVDKEKVAEIFEEVRKDGRDALLGSETYKVARAYGISAAPLILAKNAEEAIEAADEMGYPVVLKIASDKILHKTDMGGVRANLKTADEVREVFAEIMDNAKKAYPDVVPNGIEIQKMMPKGQEMIIGMMRDKGFGPMIAFGMGGIYVNLIKDASFKLAKGLTKQAIYKQIESTKAYTLLKGYRGEAPSDINSVVDTIARIAKLTLDFPEIEELDINPVFTYPDGISALDVKIKLK